MQLLGVLLVLLSASAFGAIPIFDHYAHEAGANTLTIIFCRWAIAAVCLCTYLLIQRAALPSARNLRRLMLVGGVGFVLQSWTFFTALTLISPGLVVLLLYLYPAIVVAISMIWLRQPSSLLKLTALALSLLGLVLTIGPVEQAQIGGVILGLLSALIYASYVLIVERVVQEESPLTASTVMITSAAVVYSGMLLVQGASWPVGAAGWVGITALALISTVFSIATLFTGVKLLGAPTASMLSTWEPVVTIVLSFWILQQPITGLQLLGGGFILVAVVVLALEGRSVEAHADP